MKQWKWIDGSFCHFLNTSKNGLFVTLWVHTWRRFVQIHCMYRIHSNCLTYCTKACSNSWVRGTSDRFVVTRQQCPQCFYPCLCFFHTAARSVWIKHVAMLLVSFVMCPIGPIYHISHLSNYHIIYIYNRRKFRSQTSDNMDRWKAEMGRDREKRRVEREKIRKEKESEERRYRCAKR